MDLGLHIADFTWTGGVPALGDTLARHVRDAEEAGIARITVMDHFWQLGGNLGPHEHEMLEAYTTLGFIAAHTTTALLHTLVTSVANRHPGVLAKQISTLDVLSGGRAGLGIGAAWFADEAAGLGIPFPPLAERFGRLEETVRICLQMWSGSQEPFDGEYYRLARTLSSPQALQRPRPYLMIAGGGETKTLRLVAQYADACNLGAGPQVAHKLEVLRRHCDAIGRDEGEIERTVMLSIGPRTSRDELLGQLEEAVSQGCAAAYVYAQQMPEPRRVLDLLGSVVEAVR
jgi:alkanesulfonate monooxygenase